MEYRKKRDKEYTVKVIQEKDDVIKFVDFCNCCERTMRKNLFFYTFEKIGGGDEPYKKTGRLTEELVKKAEGKNV